MTTALRRLAPAIALVALAAGVALAADPPKRVVAKVTPAKDTTVALGPVDKDGFIDYEVAFNERLRGKTTPESNAVNLLFTAVGPKPEGGELHADFYKWLGREAPAADAGYFVRMGEFFAESRGPNNQEFFDLFTELQKRPWTAKEYPKFADWLERNEKPLLAVTDASRKQDYYYPFISRPRDGSPKLLIGALLPLVQRTRELVSVLCLRAMLRCGEKTYDAAWDDLLAAHRLGRLVAKGGSMIELLVGIAVDAVARSGDLGFLEHAKLTPKQYAKCRDDLAKLPPMARVADKFEMCERFVYLEAVQAIRRYGFHGMAALFDLPTPNVSVERAEAVLAQLDWDHMLRTSNAWYDRFAVALRKPTRADRLKAVADCEADLTKAMDGKELTTVFKDFTVEKRTAASEAVGLPLLRALFPSVARLADANDRQEQNQRTLEVAFALAAHKAEFDEYPEALADLVSERMKVVSGDLYSGKPLIYRRTNSGFEVYSVGVNGRDDNCQLMTDTPRGDDLGVRLPVKGK